MKKGNPRYYKITDVNGNHISMTSRPYAYAGIEKLDGRTPLNKFYNYRFRIFGDTLGMQFTQWMNETFGTSIGYGMAKHYLKAGVDMSNIKWVVEHDSDTYTTRTYIYFNKDCEPLIFLKFK